jgi:DNA recombination protein RmuC
VTPVSTAQKLSGEIGDGREERVDHYAGIREAVEMSGRGRAGPRRTRHLVNALRSSPKARGRWGEQSLKNVLEQAGLSSTPISAAKYRWKARTGGCG